MLTRREALKIGAAAALFPSLPEASAKIDKRKIHLPTGFDPFDEAAEGGMLPGEVMSVCSTDDRLADYRTASDIHIQRMRMRQPDLSRFWHQSLWVSWDMLANSAEGVESWVKLAAKDGYKMVMLNTTYTIGWEVEALKKAALENEIAVIHTRYTLRRYYDQEEPPVREGKAFFDNAVLIQELRIWDHAIWVEPDHSGIELDIKVPEFQSRRCR